MACRRVYWLVAFWLVLLVTQWGTADDVFRYPEAKYGKGELKYINEIPVLTLAGSPEEMGGQLGELALKPAAPLMNAADEVIDQHGWKPVYGLVQKTGNLMLSQIPADHLRELDAAASTSGWPREMLVFGNTILDLRRIVQCSVVIVEGERSTTGGPLFGRNLDWPPVAELYQYTLVVVCRPDGKRAFASIIFPGILGCVSGMNDAGLAIAMLDSNVSHDGSVSFNARGIPTVLVLRRVLEECSSIEEAAALLRSVDRASMLNIAVCDKRRGAVLEVTPKNVIERDSEAGVCICTNHFRSAELATSKECWRYDKLLNSIDKPTYSVPDIAERLHAVNQGTMTLQSMVFEPLSLDLNLAFGAGPASQLPMRRLKLAEWFAAGQAP